MTRLGPPPVEALPDIAWARIERDLWTALDAAEAASDQPAVEPPARRRWLRVAGAGALIAAAAVALLVLWPTSAPTGGHGDLPSRVATAAAPTTVSFGDAEIVVAPHSTMMMSGAPSRGVDIVLEQGSATFAVAPRAGRPPFVVHAGAVDIRVVGTRFTVARSGDAARVDVAHGEVEVVAHGRRELLLAGGSWDSSRDWEAAIRSSATVVNPDDVAAAQSLADEPPPPPEPPTAPAVRAPPPDLKAAYEAAAGLEPTEPIQALTAYRRIARGSGPWAANALYAAARLADQMGDAPLALSLARQYARRFPAGANADDAAGLADRLSTP